MSSKAPREVERSDRFRREVKQLFAGSDEAEQAIAGFSETVARHPELGMAVAGRSDLSCRPIHLESGSYLIAFTFNARTVTLLTIRRVLSSNF